MHEYLNQPLSEIQLNSNINHYLLSENDTLQSITDPYKIEQILKESLPSWMDPKIITHRSKPMLIKWKCGYASCENWGRLKPLLGRNQWMIECKSDLYCRHIIDMSGMNEDSIKQFNQNFPAKLPQPVKY